ncbi:hypothetical protein [Rivibacter subsaxonicus]|uniref:Heavy-metal resistance protein n=1 Tax=Rivibacter subsaxonicus TaxID=457575 RepID=A0A4Q7W0U6_9BURK|nr:hypothetical protein [Rivibacter subsaxonicus]RZU02455.1 hypothetical protein EV670_0479 [Rivibacter subsaxonicus]
MRHEQPLRILVACLALALAAALAPASAQTAADTMQQVRDSARKDKRAFVEQQLKLDEAQAKAFWPLYERYQKELLAINRRSTVAVVDYVNVQDRLTDGAAGQLLRELTAIDTDRAKLKEAYLKRFLKVLPGKQVARYYQLENKIQAVQEYDSTSQIPLVK